MPQSAQQQVKPYQINWPVTIGVGAVLLFFCSVPLAFILYGGAGGAIGGAMILSPFLVVQYLIFRGLRRWFPNMTLGKPDEASDCVASGQARPIKKRQGEPGVGADSR
jgi:hypothetical protein